MKKYKIKTILFYISQYLVGGLFIFSGLIKLNDPVGTQIKLEEYFHVFSLDFHPIFEQLIPFALYISVFLCVIEVILGITLLMSYQLKITTYSLMIIIIFFSILTGYSAITNKVTDCGCFGDAIKLTPWESFYKDLILIAFIGILFVFRDVNEKKPSNVHHFIVSISFITCILIAILCIAYLPFIDFRAYHINSNISDKLKPSAPYQYEYHVIDSQGIKKIFTEYPTQKGYSLDTMIHKNPEARPLITDFSIWDDRDDQTQYLLNGKKAVILIQDFNKIDISKWDEVATELTKLLADTSTDEIKWSVITSTNKDKIFPLLQKKDINLPIMYGDATLLKAMLRANIGIMIFQDGVVQGKWHSNHLPNIKELLEKFH